MKKTLILCLFAFCFASAAAKKQSIAVLPCIGDFDPNGLERLRDKVEEIARDVLPTADFRLIPYKNVKEDIGDEALFNACKEGGSCFGDLAGKANADYGAWCTVKKYEGKWLLKFELYSVGDKNILYKKEYDSYNPKNSNDLIEIIKKEVPGAFKEKILGITNKQTSGDSYEYKVADSQNGKYLTDARDGKKYKIVTIGSQTWMAENLNFGDGCLENKPANCKYGRHYDWDEAMSACPKGWHLPSDLEWNVLISSVGGEKTAGKFLKATSGWDKYGNGTDVAGFAALPGGGHIFMTGGGGYPVGNFIPVGSNGEWWSATSDDEPMMFGVEYASSIGMDFDSEAVRIGGEEKSSSLSVRCIQNVAPVASNFKDSRDNKTYKVVKIGNQTWMAENINFNAEGSVCYDNKPANCQKYGRLYDWHTAFDACPKGWHLPSGAEWQELVDFARQLGGRKLKARNGWSRNSSGTDAYGFSALPGGYGTVSGFGNVGSHGAWWSSSELGNINASGLLIYDENASLYSSYKDNLLSVRCIKDL